MKKLFLAATLFICPAVMADFLSGLQAYRNKDYVKAEHEFQALLPLGNAEAVYNLAAMAYHGEGQKADLVLASAYFQLSAELGDETAQSQLPVVFKELTAAQQQQVATQFKQLQQQVVIRQQQLSLQDIGNNRVILKRKEPRYPMAAARKNLSGYVSMRLLIDEAGEVVALDTLNSFPAGVFDEAARDAVKKWQYQRADHKTVATTSISFSLGDLQAAPLEQWSQDNQLWTYALASSAAHQQALGSLLHFLALINQDALEYSEQQPFAEQLPQQFFQLRPAEIPELKIAGVSGSAEFEVDADHKVSQLQPRPGFVQQHNEAGLLGRHLPELAAGRYQLVSSGDGTAQVRPIIRLHPYYDYRFWWQKAAKNGSREAQRYLAAYDPQWEQYLLTQGDAQVQSWAAVRMALAGDKKQSQQLLNKAKHQQYDVANSLQQAL
jgi:TonB family protein